MPGVVVIGMQWGDEGKGKIVDLLSKKADIIVRFGGGNNAGHTLVVNGKQLILHLIPSGVEHKEKEFVLGHHMVLDPLALNDEIVKLQKIGLLQNAKTNLKISGLAHLIMPYHRALDGLREDNAKKGGIGTTRRGIGPTYEFKAARCGIRMEHLLYPELFRTLAEKALTKANPEIKRLGGEVCSVTSVIGLLYLASHNLSKYICNINPLMHNAYKRQKRILFEGAQGFLLDLDRGTYPFVTSSTTLASAACSGSSLGTEALDAVVGVVKAYTTRVGEGPFVTEIHGDQAEELRQKGAEYGATTGRPRRVGWLDLPALKAAAQAGATHIFITKLDVLKGMEKIYVCYAYEFRNKIYYNYNDIPTEFLSEVKPLLKEFPGFSEDISDRVLYQDLPINAQNYCDMICSELDVELAGVSVGPDRKQTINCGLFVSRRWLI